MNQKNLEEQRKADELKRAQQKQNNEVINDYNPEKASPFTDRTQRVPDPTFDRPLGWPPQPVVEPELVKKAPVEAKLTDKQIQEGWTIVDGKKVRPVDDGDDDADTAPFVTPELTAKEVADGWTLVDGQKVKPQTVDPQAGTPHLYGYIYHLHNTIYYTDNGGAETMTDNELIHAAISSASDKRLVTTNYVEVRNRGGEGTLWRKVTNPVTSL